MSPSSRWQTLPLYRQPAYQRGGLCLRDSARSVANPCARGKLKGRRDTHEAQYGHYTPH